MRAQFAGGGERTRLLTADFLKKSNENLLLLQLLAFGNADISR